MNGVVGTLEAKGKDNLRRFCASVARRFPSMPAGIPRRETAGMRNVPENGLPPNGGFATLQAMRFWWLGCSLAFLAFAAASHGASETIEVLPGSRHHLGWVFAIVSVPLPNGDTQFTVTISEDMSSHRFVEFPKGYKTSLGTMTIVDHMKEVQPPPGPLRSETASPTRTLTSTIEGHVIKCIFSVTPQEMQEPDFVFFYWIPAPDSMPSISIFYARLKKFLKPPGS